MRQKTKLTCFAVLPLFLVVFVACKKDCADCTRWWGEITPLYNKSPEEIQSLIEGRWKWIDPNVYPRKESYAIFHENAIVIEDLDGNIAQTNYYFWEKIKIANPEKGFKDGLEAYIMRRTDQDEFIFFFEIEEDLYGHLHLRTYDGVGNTIITYHNYEKNVTSNN